MTNNKLSDEQIVTLQTRLLSALSFYRQHPEKEAKRMADLLTLAGAAASEIQERRKATAEPVYQYRIRNGYNGQVTEWQTIRRDQVDFVLKAQPHNAEFQIIAATPAPVALQDHQLRELVNDLRDIAVQYHGTQQLRDRIARTVHAAITVSPNSPVIPDGWVACSEQMPDPDSEFRICVYTPTPHEDVRFRFVPASLFKSVCRDASHWQYMLPPAAPQQEAK